MASHRVRPAHERTPVAYAYHVGTYGTCPTLVTYGPSWGVHTLYRVHHSVGPSSRPTVEVIASLNVPVPDCGPVHAIGMDILVAVVAVVRVGVIAHR